MNHTYLTLTGVVGSDVERKELTDGTPLATFRLAARSRKWDYTTKSYVDGDTVWASVTCWRGLAVNVGLSVARRDRVIVHGRLRAPEWMDANGTKHTYVEIVAEAVGPDLTFGTSTFTRTSRVESARNVTRDEADAVVRGLTLTPRPEPAAQLAGGDDPGAVGPEEGEDDGDEEEEPLDELPPVDDGRRAGDRVATRRA